MSTTTAYGARPDLTDVLVITVSQSGGSPDLVASTRAAREAGAITLAVTNNPDSPLAAVSEFHIDILAGPEKALPATKTYTASLLALYLFVEGLRGGDGAAAQGLPDLAEEILARRAEVRQLAARYRFAERMVITSRGYGYPTAKEAALKLMETSYIPALSYSGADLLHGPLAMVDNISPVIAVVTEGKGGEALQPVLDRLRGRGADLVVIGARPQVKRRPPVSPCPPRGWPRRSSRSWRSCRSSSWRTRSPSPGGRTRTRRARWPRSPRPAERHRASQRRTGPGNTRGPRRRDGTLNPSGTAARSSSAGGCAVPARPFERLGAVRAESAGCLGSTLLCGEGGRSLSRLLWTRPFWPVRPSQACVPAHPPSRRAVPSGSCEVRSPVCPP